MTLPARVGPYRVVRRIGRGGMAEVLEARSGEPGAGEQRVVVKRMLPHLAAEPTYEKLFLREARIAARLRHPNVVSLLDADRDTGGDGDGDGDGHGHGHRHGDGGLYLVFELVDGVTLHELARRAWHNDLPLPIEMCIRAIADAAIGLHHAHELKDDQGKPSGLVHRDVSPDNLMIDSAGVTRVLDFGIAKTSLSATNVTRTGELRGKLAFMSPEQAEGRELDRRSDLFSLGVTLFWMLTAQKPFSGRTDDLTLKALLEQAAPAPSSLNPRVPRALDPIVLKLLAKNPAQRFATALELHRALLRLLPKDRDPELRAVAGRFVVDVLALREAKDSTVVLAMPTLPSDLVVLIDDSKAALPRDTAIGPTQTLRLPDKNVKRALFAFALAVCAGVAALVYVVTKTPASPGTSPGAPPALAPAPASPGTSPGAPPTLAPALAPAPAPASPGTSPGAPPDSAPAAPEAEAVADADIATEDVVDDAANEESPVVIDDKLVTLDAPANITWRVGRRTLKGTSARVPASTTKLTAIDRARGATHNVSVHDGRASYASLGAGTVRVWLPPAGGEVFLGPTKIGDAPLKPLTLKVGRYKMRAKSEGAVEEKLVEVRAGDNPPVRFFTR